MFGRTITAGPLTDALLGSRAPIRTTLLLAVILLLVIMAANLALFMLSRHMEHAPELAIRSALGASRARIFRHARHSSDPCRTETRGASCGT